VKTVFDDLEDKHDGRAVPKRFLQAGNAKHRRLEDTGVEDWWGMPSRPEDAEVTWGESYIPDYWGDVEENPWIQAAQTFSKAGSRKRQKMVMLGGLPHSGIDIVEAFLAGHTDEVSWLRNTTSNGHIEGMNVPGMQGALPYPYWGGGKQKLKRMCGQDHERNFRPGIHLTAEEPQVVRHFRQQSFQAWNTFDHTKPILVEKDPPNLLRMRFHQKVFAETHDFFPIFTIMHPLEIGIQYHCDPSTKIRFQVTENWLNCQRAWLEDLDHYDNYLVIPFEAWFIRFEDTAATIERYLNLKDRGRWKTSKTLSLPHLLGAANFTTTTFGACNRKAKKSGVFEQRLHIKAFIAAVERFGYTLLESTKFAAPSTFPMCKVGGRPCNEWL